jgi:hypothetical protein
MDKKTIYVDLNDIFTIYDDMNTLFTKVIILLGIMYVKGDVLNEYVKFFDRFKIAFNFLEDILDSKRNNIEISSILNLQNLLKNFLRNINQNITDLSIKYSPFNYEWDRDVTYLYKEVHTLISEIQKCIEKILKND